jgi:transposase
MVAARELLEHARGRAFIGDTGYDSNDLRAAIRQRGMFPVIASKPERRRKLPKRRQLYAKRYLVEIFFHGLKRFRAVATRYEKTAASFLSLLHVCCSVMWLNEN